MDISSKFSLYDTLAIIIPGGIGILAAFVLMADIGLYCPKIMTLIGYEIIPRHDFELLYYTILLSFAYVIGIINNFFSNKIFTIFRNNEGMIRYQLRKVVMENSIIFLNEYVNTDCICKFNSLGCLKILKVIIRKQSDHNIKCYYRAYYALAQKNLLGSIPIIESQVALLRNIVLPIGLFGLCYGIKCSYHCTSWDALICFVAILVIYIIIILMILIVMIQRQNKIYNLVWESVNYYKL